MSSHLLNQEQLKSLVAFIHKRGIKEPDVVAEIVDHLACKTEEIMSERPEIPFERALQLAHQSFGTSGFRPISKAYEDMLDKMIKTSFKSAVKATLQSPIVVLPIAATIFLYFLLHTIFTKPIFNTWYGLSFGGLILPILMILITKFLCYHALKRNPLTSPTAKVKSLWEQKSSRLSYQGFWIVFGILIPQNSLEQRFAPYLMLCYCIFSFVGMVLAWATFQTFKQMQARLGNTLYSEY